MKSTFPGILKELRIEKGLSQNELANMYSLDRTTIGKWETGNSTPSIDIIKNLADFFEVSIDYLLGYQSNTNTLGNKIRNLRKSSGLTQEELGNIVGYVKSTISLYEKGVSSPDYETLLKMANYFNVTTDYLLGRSPNSCPADSPQRDIGKNLDKLTKQLDEIILTRSLDDLEIGDDILHFIIDSIEDTLILAKHKASETINPDER